MNPEDQREPIHCDCGKPKAPGETTCRQCATGGFPSDEGYEGTADDSSQLD